MRSPQLHALIPFIGESARQALDRRAATNVFPLSLWERFRVRAFAFKQSTAIQDTL